jgi:hypothetical protein
VRRLRRFSGASQAAGLAAFEDAPCFLEFARGGSEAQAEGSADELDPG